MAAMKVTMKIPKLWVVAGALMMCTSCSDDGGDNTTPSSTGGTDASADTTGGTTGGGVTGGSAGGTPTGGATGGGAMGGTPSGGMMTTGGAPTGGMVTGGTPTGGAPSGGMPTGGTPTGGTMGGVPMGGTPMMCMIGDTRCVGDNLEACQQDGTFMQVEACAFGCSMGQCNPDPSLQGSCQSPIALPLDGTQLNGTTNTSFMSADWSNACRSRYQAQTMFLLNPLGPEQVYEINTSMAQWVRIIADPVTNTIGTEYSALHVRGTCDEPATEILSACSGGVMAGDPADVTVLLAAGQHAVIIDSFDAADMGSPYDFTISAQPVAPPPCGMFFNAIPQVLQFDANGLATASGDTALGTNGALWPSGMLQCPDRAMAPGETSGREVIYAFALRETRMVTITATPTMPAINNDIAVYLRPDRCDAQNVSNPSARGVTGTCALGSDGAAASFDATLTAGTYFVVVDDFSNSVDSPQAFDLTVQLN